MAGSMTRIASEVAPSEAAVMNDGCWTVVAPSSDFPTEYRVNGKRKLPHLTPLSNNHVLSHNFVQQ
jgi:hypothetical protein